MVNDWFAPFMELLEYRKQIRLAMGIDILVDYVDRADFVNKVTGWAYHSLCCAVLCSALLPKCETSMCICASTTGAHTRNLA